ncbi:nucleocapsid protein [Wufeng Rhinolophus pearsonii paramyxovirus 1]|uniref:Nucleocapsid n=1 Tax=Wufeng Rhinolophus pearsonii paramyxovirus 1 TaxID=2877502 RepID=A0AAE8XR92_9MONO|nr:nucleocapsid protein [Wufeng Rhinolophus pearsonii paramyxovirus 1]
MSQLIEGLSNFRLFKNNPPKAGILSNVLGGIRKKVIILIPGTSDPELRWNLLVLMLMLIWSHTSPGSVITGAFFTLLSLFADQPAQLLRTVGNDPDIEAQFIEVTITNRGDLKLSSRGADLSEQKRKYEEIAAAGPDKDSDPNPFAKLKIRDHVVRTTELLQQAVATVTLQMWILLTKAVTAPDTARDSEQRRWIKYIQQKRADDEYRLKSRWLDVARNRIASDISVRRLMVEILVEINKIQGTKSRIVEMIADVGNYIAETGMAGFHLTIKYGIETRYPALALNEFQSDLTTLIQLMKLYQEQGEKAPYLVLLEDSIQTKFSPGNYPLLWSYAMGVGTAIDRAMNGLNYNRPYLEPGYFKLGQDIVNKMEGNVDSKIAAELGLTSEQINDLKSITQTGNQDRSAGPGRSRTSRFVPTAVSAIETESSSSSSDESDDDQSPPKPTKYQLPSPKPRKTDVNSQNRSSLFGEEIRRLAGSALAGIRQVQADVHSHDEPDESGQDQESEADKLRSEI